MRVVGTLQQATSKDINEEKRYGVLYFFMQLYTIAGYCMVG